MTADLFDGAIDVGPAEQKLAEGAVLLRGFARSFEHDLMPALHAVTDQAPFRHMHTPGGHQMSVAMTNCGCYGWVTDRSGYRYDALDPQSGQAWPTMPDVFLLLARQAADRAGFAQFSPDACLINRYEPGARLSLHQDRDEQDLNHPVVSISLGLPAIFQFGGNRRNDKLLRVPLFHGDIVVWGGPSRLFHHGVLALKEGEHPILGRRRFNLTLRKAL